LIRRLTSDELQWAGQNLINWPLFVWDQLYKAKTIALQIELNSKSIIIQLKNLNSETRIKSTTIRNCRILSKSPHKEGPVDKGFVLLPNNGGRGTNLFFIKTAQ
jgi:hypothetical protein